VEVVNVSKFSGEKEEMERRKGSLEFGVGRKEE